MLTRNHAPARPRRWRVALLTALTLASTGSAVALSTPAQAVTINPSAWYVIVSRHSAKVIDLYNLSTADGAPIVQWSRNNGNQQQWQFVDAGSGYYKLRSRHSGKFLELPNALDGTQLVQNPDNGSTRQHFAVRDNPGRRHHGRRQCRGHNGDQRVSAVQRCIWHHHPGGTGSGTISCSGMIPSARTRPSLAIPVPPLPAAA